MLIGIFSTKFATKYRIFFIFLLYFLNLHSYGQKPKVDKIDSTKKYHLLINDAELKICDKQFKTAIQIYDKAFVYLKTPFVKDIYNCLLLCIYEKKYKPAFGYSRKLIQLGATLKFFDQYPLYNLKNDQDGWVNFIHDYPIFLEQYYKKIDFNLRNELMNLNIIDQNVFCPRQENFKISGFSEILFSDLKDILLEQGYPNEYKIGLFIENDTVMSELPQDVIIRHMYQEHYGNLDDISEILKRSVFEGKLDPFKYANDEMFKHQPNNFYGVESLVKVKDNFYIPKPNF
ncbi:MAG: hypothetical protein IPH57_01490 [Saprospiraceae bacterium]|nr:hypothetical protein [Saprospiraceae bacterium]